VGELLQTYMSAAEIETCPLVFKL